MYLERVRNAQEVPYDKDTITLNEIKEYLDCRYICEQDTCWRIFGVDMHRHYPAIERMPVHLPNENYITFKAKARMNRVLSQKFLRRTMLTQWFVTNQDYPEARNLTYIEFPSRWKWESEFRTWKRRCHDHGKIGRLNCVHPYVREHYYLRMLLLVVKGARSFEELRTYKEAYRSHGLVGDDQELYSAFEEALAWASAPQLRKLFVTMILFCEIGDELAFFERLWKSLAKDVSVQACDR